MQTIGQAWLVLKLTNSGTALGLVTALQFLPILFLGAMGGVIADRLSKRKILFFTQTASGILALILGILVATDTVQLWMIYILATSLGFINAIDNPTRRTFIIEMVGNKELRNAITLFSTVFNLSRVIGPAIAGGIIAGFGLALCFLINAASYIAVLICLFLMRKEELHVVEPVKRAKGQLREGLKYVSDTPLLRNVLFMMAIIGTLTYEFQVNLPLFAKFTFNGDASYFAFLNSAMGIGAVVGGLATASRKKSTSRGLIKTAFGFGVAVILASLAPTFHIALVAMFIVGIFSITFTSQGDTILQLESAPNMRSRVVALWSVAFLGSTPIGGPIIGWIGEYAGPRWSLATSGFAAIAASIFGLIMLWNYVSPKSTEQIPEPAPTIEPNKVI
jgi:MFS family permease